MKKKNKKNLKFLLILILIILFVKVFFLKNLSNIEVSDDLLFIKLLGSKFLNATSYQYTKEKEYNLKVSYKNIDFKYVNLSETIDREKNVYEKIAPGTSGSFNILLNSNQNLRYKILFCSINEKPKNLKFKAVKDRKEIGIANTLEDLSDNLTGYIRKNENINIIINWYWDYEDDEKADIQDTKDAKDIKEYRFNISTIGEELY